MGTYPKHCFNDPKRTFDDDFEDLGPYKYDLAMIKWVLCEFVWRKERKRDDWLRQARDYAVRSGRVEMLKLVFSIYTEQQTSAKAAAIALDTWMARAEPRIMDETASNGHLTMLKLLHSHPGMKCTANAMDLAAANGHSSFDGYTRIIPKGVLRMHWIRLLLEVILLGWSGCLNIDPRALRGKSWIVLLKAAA